MIINTFFVFRLRYYLPLIRYYMINFIDESEKISNFKKKISEYLRINR